MLSLINYYPHIYWLVYFTNSLICIELKAMHDLMSDTTRLCSDHYPGIGVGTPITVLFTTISSIWMHARSPGQHHQAGFRHDLWFIGIFFCWAFYLRWFTEVLAWSNIQYMWSFPIGQTVFIDKCGLGPWSRSQLTGNELFPNEHNWIVPRAINTVYPYYKPMMTQ